jgi:cytochrome c oxidase subunit 2
VRTVGAAAAVSLAILFVYHFDTVRTGRMIGSLSSVARGQAPLTIEVVGHQWWWEFLYRDTVPDHEVWTANELHIPVGRAVRLRGTARDVIHSFWVPNLHGKRDLIPGHVNTGVLRADSAGRWTGECGEFCGHQHANMRFVVVAEPPAAFNRWYEEQLAAAAQPADSAARRGQDVFLSSGCVLCHQINGTPAGGRVGPNLTHLASRAMIGAGALPNTRGHLAGWVVDPQRIKPGVKMPPQNLSPDDLNALLDYLRSLR